MSKCLRDNLTFLTLLLQTSERQRQQLLESATPSQVRALGEICLNICLGRFNKEINKLDSEERKEVIQNIQPVQKVASKHISFRKKRKALSRKLKDQKGAGLFSVLLPLALTALPALLKK